MIEFQNVSKMYVNDVYALYNVNFRIQNGEFVFLLVPAVQAKLPL